MSKLVYLCLGIVLLAAQFGCGGSKTNNVNGSNVANANGSVNPANPNNPNVPPDVNAPGGGPIAQSDGKPGKPSLANANTIAPAPTDSTGMSMSSMDFHGAQMRGSKEQMAALMADDFKGTMADGSVQNKQQALDAVKPSTDMFSANVQPPKIAGDTATVTGTITMMGSDPKAAGPGQVYHFTDIWKKRGAKWLLVTTTVTK